MSQFYFSVNLDDTRILCIAPLSDNLIAASGDDIADTSGYFLYEMRRIGDRRDIEIIAHVSSDDAAIRLSEMMGMR